MRGPQVNGYSTLSAGLVTPQRTAIYDVRPDHVRLAADPRRGEDERPPSLPRRRGMLPVQGIRQDGGPKPGRQVRLVPPADGVEMLLQTCTPRVLCAFREKRCAMKGRRGWKGQR